MQLADLARGLAIQTLPYSTCRHQAGSRLLLLGCTRCQRGRQTWCLVLWWGGCQHS